MPTREVVSMTISSCQIELLYMEGCPNRYPAYKTLIGALQKYGLETAITQVLVSNDEEAEQCSFLGSPTIRINGQDVEVNPGGTDDYYLHQRLYLTDEGFRGYPSQAMILSALKAQGN